MVMMCMPTFSRECTAHFTAGTSLRVTSIFAIENRKLIVTAAQRCEIEHRTSASVSEPKNKQIPKFATRTEAELAEIR